MHHPIENTENSLITQRAQNSDVSPFYQHGVIGNMLSSAPYASINTTTTQASLGNTPLATSNIWNTAPALNPLGVRRSNEMTAGALGGRASNECIPTQKRPTFTCVIPPRPGPIPEFLTKQSYGIENLQSNITARAEPVYSRKVFVGGLPPDIDEHGVERAFSRFGAVAVDWPHKADSNSHFPPKGYAFLIFAEESSVRKLIECARIDQDGKMFVEVSSLSMRSKPVQIRPWLTNDSDFVFTPHVPLDPRKTVFVGGVPRPLKAAQLAEIMNRLFGGVCYAGVDTDPDLKYPKGAGRVAFDNQQSYMGSIAARFVQLRWPLTGTADIDKKVEVKPYVLDDQMCDECHGQKHPGAYAPFYCPNMACLQYFCKQCWDQIHAAGGRRDCHKPLVKDGAERPKGLVGRFAVP